MLEASTNVTKEASIGRTKNSGYLVPTKISNEQSQKLAFLKNFLKEHGIPSEQIKTFTKVWHTIIFQHPLYNKVSKLGCAPTRDEFAQCDESGTNMWHHFADAFRQIEPHSGRLTPEQSKKKNFLDDFQASYFDNHKIYPTSEDLGRFSHYYNANTWAISAGSSYGQRFFHLMLQKNIRPKTEYLEQPVQYTSGRPENTFEFLSKRNRPLLQSLYELDIIPTKPLFPEEFGPDPWYYFGPSNRGVRIKFFELRYGKANADLIERVNYRVQRRQKMADRLSIEPDSVVATLLTRPDINKLYDYFIVFQQSLQSEYLPSEIMCKIAEYTGLFPSHINIHDLFFSKNRLALNKFHVLDLLEIYNRKPNRHGKRINSLMDAIRNCKDIQTLYKLLWTQYWMFKIPGKISPLFEFVMSIEESPTQHDQESSGASEALSRTEEDLAEASNYYKKEPTNHHQGGYFNTIKTAMEFLRSIYKELVSLNQTLKQAVFERLTKDQEMSGAESHPVRTFGIFAVKEYDDEKYDKPNQGDNSLHAMHFQL